MIGFGYEAAVLARFPAVVGGVILARGLRGGPTPAAVQELYGAEQQATIERIGQRPLSELPALAAWRRAFSAFGVAPTQYRGAAEALLRRLTKQGDIPSINLLVDLGNLVSIRYALPVAVFDARAMVGPLTVRFARGDERFTDLGATTSEVPAAGEVIFVDRADVVFARRWCWRQSAESAATEETTEAVITVEAHHEGGAATVQAALTDLEGLFAQWSGGQLRSGVVSAASPRLDE